MSNIHSSRRSGLVLRGGRNVRKTFWLAGVFAQTTRAAASSAAILTNLNAAALALRPFIVVRVRGVYAAVSDQVVTSEDYSGVLGHIVVSDQAVAIGVTAILTPTTDSGSGYHVYQPFMGEMIAVSPADILHDSLR